jgi:hypothetical protein
LGGPFFTQIALISQMSADFRRHYAAAAVISAQRIYGTAFYYTPYSMWANGYFQHKSTKCLFKALAPTK